MSGYNGSPILSVADHPLLANPFTVKGIAEIIVVEVLIEEGQY
jgi:hypothetical protein